MNVQGSPASDASSVPLSFIKEEAKTRSPAELPILFIHGAESSKETWTGPINALKDRHTIYAIDLRGHGETPIGDAKEFSLQNLVNDVRNFVHQEHLNRFILVAHSMGTRIATAFAADYPEFVAGYVIEDMEMLPREKEIVSEEELHALSIFKQRHPTIKSAAEELERYGYSRAKIDSWIRQNRIVETPHGVHIGINPWVTLLAKNNISASIEPMEKMKKLAESKIPVLLMKAEADSSVSPEGLQRMKNAYPEMEVCIIPNATHSIHKADLDAFLYQLHGFIDTLERSQ
ncbi:alpha/beta fold hydrolase [Estrella lausannensis]|uniref:Alpha/beta hydrolase n=1 Tax=Estrella lausannensis TaxID=483423 RepID=A0A0H5DNY8_9BACT|nr:alpha/beta hydrolase [Estrella lausannensis]CRX38052.1 Alpha/beta hydrolase [Estrella lausannensis]